MTDLPPAFPIEEARKMPRKRNASDEEIRRCVAEKIKQANRDIEIVVKYADKVEQAFPIVHIIIHEEYDLRGDFSSIVKMREMLEDHFTKAGYYVTRIGRGLAIRW